MSHPAASAVASQPAPASEDPPHRPAATVRAAQHQQPGEEQHEAGDDVGGPAALRERQDDVAVAHLQGEDDRGGRETGQRRQREGDVAARLVVRGSCAGGAGSATGRAVSSAVARTPVIVPGGRAGCPRVAVVPVPRRVPTGRDIDGTGAGHAALPDRDGRRPGFSPCHRPTAPPSGPTASPGSPP